MNDKVGIKSNEHETFVFFISMLKKKDRKRQNRPFRALSSLMIIRVPSQEPEVRKRTIEEARAVSQEVYVRISSGRLPVRDKKCRKPREQLEWSSLSLHLSLSAFLYLTHSLILLLESSIFSKAYEIQPSSSWVYSLPCPLSDFSIPSTPFPPTCFIFIICIGARQAIVPSTDGQ